MLITYFEGKIGEDLVKRGDYSISSEDGKLLLGSDNWGSVVRKGTVLVMSMVVKKVALEQGARRQRNTCPDCYETELGVMPDKGWSQW